MATKCFQDQAVFRAPWACGCGAGQSGALGASEQTSEGFVRVCVCVCVRGRETDRQIDTENLREIPQGPGGCRRPSGKRWEWEG